MTDPNEKELNSETENDIFKCDECKKTRTRKEIRKIWKSIPFGSEKRKKYYCGCMGWD